VRITYAAKPDLCGDGVSFITRGDTRTRSWDRRRDPPCPCERGPARLTLRVAGGRVVDVKAGVGPGVRPARDPITDLGTVSVREAGRYLLTLAREGRSPEVGKDAVFAATLADSLILWPDLLEIARAAGIPTETRTSATFGLGQIAGDAIAERLGDLVEDEDVDLEIREQAIFALSQRPHGEGVPALIHVVRTNRDPRLVKKALFRLGDTGDPRAVDLFEEILTRH
jgi:hypothetical protein